MTRDEWLSQFEDELKKLRPHIGDRLATTIALRKYDQNGHPRGLARQYDKKPAATGSRADQEALEVMPSPCRTPTAGETPTRAGGAAGTVDRSA